MPDLNFESDPTVHRTDIPYRENKLVTTIPYQDNQFCIGSPRVEGKPTEDDRHPSCGTVQMEEEVSSPSGVQNHSDLDRQYRQDNVAFFNDLQNNLEAMLCDVVKTNQQAQSVSAFLSIPAFIGFLSKLAFNNNASVPDAKADGFKYVRFLERFVLGNKSWRNERVKNQNGDIPGIATVLYCMVRCGLLHGATLTDSRMVFDGITVKLTHQEKSPHSLAEYDGELKRRCGGKPSIEIVLNAFDLCSELKCALSNMFGECKSDFDLATSIQTVYKDEPTFAFYRAREFSTGVTKE